jgi:hypothetical protein
LTTIMRTRNAHSTIEYGRHFYHITDEMVPWHVNDMFVRIEYKRRTTIWTWKLSNRSTARCFVTQCFHNAFKQSLQNEWQQGRVLGSVNTSRHTVHSKFSSSWLIGSVSKGLAI